MPQRAAQAKSLRSNRERNKRNKSMKSRIRTETIKFERAVERGDADEAAGQLKPVTKLLHKAASKGIIHKNTAARRQSRLQAKLNNLDSE